MACKEAFWDVRNLVRRLVGSRAATAAERRSFERIVELVPQLKPYRYGGYAHVKDIASERGFSTLGEYCAGLEQDPSEVEYLAENITLKGSHFFRGVGGYETLDRECLPALAKRDKVRVWCAGCSSGEEVYSLVMALAEHVDPDRIEVLATDYNEELLERCRRASYSVSRLEEVPERYRHYLCMSDTGKRFSFSDELLGSVTVRHLNLLEDEYPEEFDLISCRNVIKFFVDGTNEMGDCLSTEPFHNDPTGTNYGEAYATMEEMRDVMVRLNEEKLDLHVHTICDGAFRLMCDAVEAAQKICGDDWCIKITLAHCEIIHPDDIPRVRQLGIYIDYSTHWAGGYFGEGAIPYLGQERWNTMHDYHKIIEDGGKVGFSSDVFSYQEATRANPMIGMQVAMTRVDPWVPLDPEKYPGSVRPPVEGKLSIEQLIHGYTVVNAERMRLDDKMGSLEAGKLANLVVFKEAIFRAAHEHPETFSEIDPECTWFEGEERHIVSELKKDR